MSAWLLSVLSELPTESKLAEPSCLGELFAFLKLPDLVVSGSFSMEINFNTEFADLRISNARLKDGK